MPTVPGGAKARQARRRRLFDKQRGRCHWCSLPMTLDKARRCADDYATFEHLVPRAVGGLSDRQNVVLAHRLCNMARGTGPARLASVAEPS